MQNERRAWKLAKYDDGCVGFLRHESEGPRVAWTTSETLTKGFVPGEWLYSPSGNDLVWDWKRVGPLP